MTRQAGAFRAYHETAEHTPGLNPKHSSNIVSNICHTAAVAMSVVRRPSVFPLSEIFLLLVMFAIAQNMTFRGLLKSVPATDVGLVGLCSGLRVETAVTFPLFSLLHCLGLS